MLLSGSQPRHPLQPRPAKYLNVSRTPLGNDIQAGRRGDRWGRVGAHAMPASTSRTGAPPARPFILGLGSCGMDSLALVKQYPRPDEKIRTEKLEVGWLCEFGGLASATGAAWGPQGPWPSAADRRPSPPGHRRWVPPSPSFPDFSPSSSDTRQGRKVRVRITTAAPCPASTLQVQGGGNCGNALTAAARLGQACAIVSKIGRDAVGDSIASELEADGVSTQYLIRDDSGLPSPLTYIIVDKAGATVKMEARDWSFDPFEPDVHRRCTTSVPCVQHSHPKTRSHPPRSLPHPLPQAGRAHASTHPAQKCSCRMWQDPNSSMLSSRLAWSILTAGTPRRRRLWRPPSTRGVRVCACVQPRLISMCSRKPALEPGCMHGSVRRMSIQVETTARTRHPPHPPGIPMLVEGERPRQGLDNLLHHATYVSTNATFPLARPGRGGGGSSAVMAGAFLGTAGRLLPMHPDGGPTSGDECLPYRKPPYPRRAADRH